MFFPRFAPVWDVQFPGAFAEGLPTWFVNLPIITEVFSTEVPTPCCYIMTTPLHTVGFCVSDGTNQVISHKTWPDICPRLCQCRTCITKMHKESETCRSLWNDSSCDIEKDLITQCIVEAIFHSPCDITHDRISQPCVVIKMVVCLYLYDIEKGYFRLPPSWFW